MPLSEGQRPRVAIVGAGPSGLTTARQAQQFGCEVRVFERNNDIGGVWHMACNPAATRRPIPAFASMFVSKEVCAFSELEISEQFPTFMRSRDVLAYLTLYAQQFDLRKYVAFGAEVRKVCRANGWEQNGKWQIQWQDVRKDGKQEGVVHEEQFDAVLLCTGMRQRGWRPPEWRLEKQFKGRVLHSEHLKDPSEFANQTVCVVGLGNSGVCIAAELAQSAKQVILSTRRGGWLLRPWCPSARPWDRHFHTRWHCWWRQWVPKLVRTKLWEWTAPVSTLQPVHHHRTSEAMNGLGADNGKHSLLNSHLTFDTSGKFGSAIASGQIRLKPDVWSLSDGNLIEFVDGSVEDGVDAVILCTGYEFDFRFVEDGTLLAVRHNDFHLYKHMFAPELAPHHNLAVLGHVQPIGGCIWPIAELQARLFFQVLKEQHQLPSPFWMKGELEKRRCAVSVNYLKTRRHTQIEDHVQFCLELAQLVNAADNNMVPSAWQLFLADPRLALAIWFGPLCSAQFRIWNGTESRALTKEKEQQQKEEEEEEKEEEADRQKKKHRQVVLNAGKQSFWTGWPPHWRCLIGGGVKWTGWLLLLLLLWIGIALYRWPI